MALSWVITLIHDDVLVSLFFVLLISFAFMAEWRGDSIYYIISATISLWLGISLHFVEGFHYFYFAILVSVFFYFFMLFIAKTLEYFDISIGGEENG